jgi:hypothetical protein
LTQKLSRLRTYPQAAVDSSGQVIIAADVISSGSEQTMLVPMIEQAAPYRACHTLVTSDASYHSDANVQHLLDNTIPAMIADNQMRSRDERFAEQDKYKGKPDPLSEKKATGQPKQVKRIQPKDFAFNDDNTATCPAGKVMSSLGTIYTSSRGLHYQAYTAKALDCNACKLSGQCLKGPSNSTMDAVDRSPGLKPNPKSPPTQVSACAKLLTHPPRQTALQPTF